VRTGRKAEYGYIFFWIFWVMFCVRYVFTLGLIGSGQNAPILTTALFVSAFCLSIPAVLLIFDLNRQCTRLTCAAAAFCAVGLILLFPAYIPVWIPAAFLALGSGMLTCIFLHLFAYSLGRRRQLLAVIVFLAVKPVFSFLALTVSTHLKREWYLAAAGLVLAGITACGLLIGEKAVAEKHAAPVCLSGEKMIWIYILFALVILERMNGVFKLYGGHEAAPFNYDMYFIGCLIAAALSWLLFMRKKLSTVYAFITFAASSILHFALSIASSSGVLACADLDMIFFGIADIVYVFLFVTAAKLSASQVGKGVFVGFVCVFGFALFAGFGISHLLYTLFKETNAMVYSLISLVIVAASLLFTPVFFKIERTGYGRQVKNTPENENAPVSEASENPTRGLLTTREDEVVRLLLKGYSGRQISEALFIAPSTVKVHCRSIYEKLNIHSRAELLFLYMGTAENS